MISKYKLQKLGFDYLDQNKKYSEFLKEIEPAGKSNFKLAYAYGLGMLLDLNNEYIDNADTNDKKPEYLHLVLSSDSDTLPESVSQNQISLLQNEMIEQLEKGL